MKKILCLIIGITHLVTASVCMAYKAECLNTKGKFSKCSAEINEGTLSIKYKSKKWRHLDKSILGNNITSLSGGEYARRRVGESIASAVLLGPLFLFMLFSKKKRDNYGIEYVTNNGNKDVVLVQMKKKYGFAFGQQLKTISGKEIQQESNEAPAEQEQYVDTGYQSGSSSYVQEKVEVEVEEPKPEKKKVTRRRSNKYHR